MGKKDPLLSVIIPCWNDSRYLPPLLDSIIAQTYNEWRVLVVDDQSTDDSVEILQEYNRKDSRIQYSVRERMPKGAQTCRNIGMDISVGSKYVIFFDSDDVIAPYCFQQRVEYMEQHQELDFAVAPAKTFHGEDLQDTPCTIYGYPFFKENALKSFFYGPIPYVVWNNIYRRDSLIKYSHTWDEKILSKQDSDYNIQALIKGLKFDYIEDAKIDYFWRTAWNPDSITKNIRHKNHFDSHLYFFNKTFESVVFHNLLGTYEKDLLYYAYTFVILFSIGKSRQHVRGILRSGILNGHQYFKYRLLLFSLLPLHLLNNTHRGWLEALFFPSIHRCQRGRKACIKRQISNVIKNIL